MFLKFFYLLRERGINVSLNEWMMLIEALDKGLCKTSLTAFYYLCRSIIVKSEADFDKFDLTFAEFFKDIKTPDDIPADLWKWLNEDIHVRDMDDKNLEDYMLYSLEELQKMLKERIEEQKEKHDGGSYWVGSGGTSTMGHSGYHERGIRVGGESRHNTAVQVAMERKFKDFREDNVLNSRQFQVAFRKLRQFSTRTDEQKTELDVGGTIDKTCENAGNLSLVWDRPRKNTVKLLILFDSDGSMTLYSKLCAQLFKAVSGANHFKDLKVYYFHNCIYEHLYTTPYCRRGEWVDTEWVLGNLGSDYKVIFVGDAAMAPSELLAKGGNSYIGLYNEIPGIEWLKRFKNRYKKVAWLNPILEEDWDVVYGSQSIKLVREVFKMYELTLDGLEKAIKSLMVSR